ncbi:MAG TPA: N-acyl homoserine lactonase family protein [Pseudomonadales bacterium]|nr:N-acyl homoserine lactonase family protein [Pseudomonadales bacterium]
MRSILTLLPALLLLVACGEPAPSAGTAPAPEAAVAAKPTADLRLYVFDCGYIRLPTVTDFGLADDQTDVRTLFVPCYLIEHPAGLLLWDAGLPPAFAATGDWIDDETGAGHRLGAPISAQLGVLDLTPADIDKIAFSHFHYDHVGDANAFLGSELLIQRPEQAMAFSDDPSGAFMDPAFYGELAATPTTILDGDHDVFGDGRVRIISAPGHTPGHQVLYVDLQNTGPIVLSGDLYHFEASRDLHAVPTFNYDADASRAAMDRVEAFLSETGATLWIQHVLAFHEGLAQAPEFHD